MPLRRLHCWVGDMTDDELPIVERGLLAMSDVAWDQAVRQAAVIAPLATLDVVSVGHQAGLPARGAPALRWHCGAGDRHGDGAGPLAPGDNVFHLFPGVQRCKCGFSWHLFIVCHCGHPSGPGAWIPAHLALRLGVCSAWSK